MTGHMNAHPAPISIDDDLAWLSELAQALKQLGAQRDVDQGQTYDFSIRWGTALAGRLPRLVHYSSRGMLTADDERRFHDLCNELRGLSDLIERLRLTRPALSSQAERCREPKPATSRRGLRLRRG